MLFQKRVARAKLDIYVSKIDFIFIIINFLMHVHFN